MIEGRMLRFGGGRRVRRGAIAKAYSHQVRFDDRETKAEAYLDCSFKPESPIINPFNGLGVISFVQSLPSCIIKFRPLPDGSFLFPVSPIIPSLATGTKRTLFRKRIDGVLVNREQRALP